VLEVTGVSAGEVDLQAIEDRVGAVAGSVVTASELIRLTIPTGARVAPAGSPTGLPPGL